MHAHSPTDTLVRMANQIGKFFRAQGDERAIAGVANHVRKFWEPRMKKQIFAFLDEGGAGLDPIALKGLQKLKTDMHGFTTAAEAKAAAEAHLAKGNVAAPQAAKDTAKPAKNGGKSARR